MNNKRHERPNDSLRNEYTEVQEYIRHYSNLRWVIFSIFFALIGVAGIILFDNIGKNDYSANLAKVGGLIFTLVFFNFHERLIQLVSYYIDRGKELESLLEFNLISGVPRPKFPIIETQLITRVLFLIVTVFWIYTFFRK